MFTDESVDSVSLPSAWRKSEQAARESTACQTTALRHAEAEVQTVSTSDGSTQTEPRDLSTQQPLQQQQTPGLMEFLQRVEELVIRELQKNRRSHAFDSFQPSWEDQGQQVCRLHHLQHGGAQEKGLHVTSLSWSCTGSVIACAYGRIDDGDWSTERACVCTWNLDLRGLRSEQADLVIDVPTAVMALCCHPTQPALIAGGLYSGEVLVWDTSRTQDPVLAQTGLSAEGHREPVYQVAWVALHKKGEFGVLSAGSGGQVLLWTLDSDCSLLVLHAAYALLQQQVPHSSSASFKGRGSSTVGVTSLALSPWDPDTFLVGSEGGLLLRCSFSSQTLAAALSQDSSMPVRAPAVFSFKPYSGPVHSIHCSPFHRNLFVAAGTDGMVHLHSLLQAHPLLSLRVSESYVFQVQWSPSRPLVLATATGQGEVHLFDLGRRTPRPVATVESGGSAKTATCLSFNRRRPELLAVGKTDGTVSVWRLSAELTEQGGREGGALEQIAQQVAE
ncbi:unnamed protein product [Ophioblennius macclurei]